MENTRRLIRAIRQPRAARETEHHRQLITQMRPTTLGALEDLVGQQPATYALAEGLVYADINQYWSSQTRLVALKEHIDAAFFLYP